MTKEKNDDMATMPLADLATGIRKHTMKMDSRDPLKILVMNVFAKRFTEAAQQIEDLETRLAQVSENCGMVLAGFDSITAEKLSVTDRLGLIRENMAICEHKGEQHGNTARHN